MPISADAESHQETASNRVNYGGGAPSSPVGAPSVQMGTLGAIVQIGSLPGHIAICSGRIVKWRDYDKNWFDFNNLDWFIPRSDVPMTRTIVNFWLDLLLLVVFLLLLWVSTVIRFVFPPAVDSPGTTLWGGTVDQWIGLQFSVVGLLTFLLLLHVMLHWKWVCGVLASTVLRGKDGKKRTLDDGVRTLYGVGLMIVLLNILGLATAVAVLTIKTPTY